MLSKEFESLPNIYLVGPMGAGKTTVGRHLAELLGREFLDSDHEIERKTGATIPWIFEKEGERLTKNLLEPTYLKRDQIENIIEMTNAIRHTKTFLVFKESDALGAVQNIEELEEYRTSINSEE